MPRRRIEEWMVERIKQLKKEGLSNRRIAEKLGISETTVFNYLNPDKANLSIKRIQARNRSIEVPEGAGLQCPYCRYKWMPYTNHIPPHCPNCKHILSKLPKIVWGVKPRKQRLERKWKEIVKAYKSGKSLPQLAREYNASLSGIRTLLVRHGVKLRSESEALLHHSKNWRKLARMSREYGTRIISIPTVYLKALGYRGDEELLGRWEVKRGGLYLRIKKA
jgi:DNA-binding CsgD family transcriptional regulator